MASLTGVAAPTPAWPLGLVNTSRQIGGAIGLAAPSTIAATSTNHYLHSHAALTPSSAVALDHGFQTALSVLTGLLLWNVLVWLLS